MLRRLFATKIGYTNSTVNFIYLKPNEIHCGGDYDIVEVETELDSLVPKTNNINFKKIGESNVFKNYKEINVINVINDKITHETYPNKNNMHSFKDNIIQTTSWLVPGIILYYAIKLIN